MPDHWLKRDAATFLRHFGEDVVIVEGTTERTVRAIVDRLPPGLGRDGKRLEARIVLDLANDPVAGIDAGTVDTGRVRVRLAHRLGGAVKDWSVGMSEDGDGWADAGMVRVQLR